MLYFGTSLDQPGHFIWELTGGLYRVKSGYPEPPFDLYEYKNNPKGHAVFVQSEKYTALHIAGSCIDRRFGTVSVFWLNGSYSEDDFLEILRGNATAMQIIYAMPFAVDKLKSN